MTLTYQDNSKGVRIPLSTPSKITIANNTKMNKGWFSIQSLVLLNQVNQIFSFRVEKIKIGCKINTPNHYELLEGYLTHLCATSI